MYIVVPSIGCVTITKGIKMPVEDVVWTPENHHNGRRSLPVAMCQTPEDTNSATAGVVALCCCRNAHILPNCVAQTACRRTVRTTTCYLCAFAPSARQSAVALGP
ncbi:hypothetical protein AVEN_222126-1 [Araneus ventricosus]|uniref:Uncharacterized protein n=1 Tax=Araneus ventricosus TaxID=182803 RepID=A0A4Y2DWH8_ARAVE|nr:hypothetical protein AVEN_222126-1 [Araneus ventricosus]